MFSANEIQAVIKMVGKAPVAQYADAHNLFPTVDKLIKLGETLKQGGVLVHLTDLEAEAIAAARKAAAIPVASEPQPLAGALESSQT